MKNNNNVLYDMVTNTSITINKDGDLCLVGKDGKYIKLCDNQRVLDNMITYNGKCN